ncbi:hypothetical protein [Breoghania sp. L-A4]|uniref:outer membrane protein n=1 Tax=Breoghania sp. L-A4 TaxID=2304600 RepID=UPI000E35E158|nr:hypothetical protein [Breoghania sp. L-A4]AXS40406.1 hypothetical protein D1F64_10485 [Breoghania sp. L-A4]
MGSFVFGGEIGASLVDLEEDSRYFSFGANRSRVMSLDNLITATAQVGFAFDRWLVLAKGGYAGGEIYTYGSNLDLNIYGSDTKFEHGWTLGAAIERAVSDRVSFGVGYDYVSIDGTDRVVPCVNAVCTVGFSDIQADVHIVKAVLNVKIWTP